jgi:hypothetical protein
MKRSTYSNMNSHPRRPLIASRKIITDPRNISRKGGINPHHSNEYTRIHHSRNAASRRGKHDGEANGDQRHEEENEG